MAFAIRRIIVLVVILLLTLIILYCSTSGAGRSTIKVQGCNVRYQFPIDGGGKPFLWEVLKAAGPLPKAVNGLFIITPNGEYFYSLADAETTNGAGQFPLKVGFSILLVHSE